MFSDFSLEKFAILAFFCFIGAIIDAIAGGGGLISLPAYFSIGLDPHVALGTNKLSSALSTVVSAFKFWKSGKVQKEIVKNLFLYSFAGAIIGVKVAVSIDSKYFKPISFFILILVLIYVVKNKKIGEQSFYSGVTKKSLIYGKIMALLLGFYDGFLGPGTGSFLIFCLIKIFKIDFSMASGNTKILNLSSNLTSLILFIYLGKVHFLYGLSVSVIMSIGAIIGSRLAILKGNKFIKPVFLTVTIVLILKMGREIFFS